MNKKYNLFNKEKKIYNYWKNKGFFNPKNKNNKKNFSIIMPPPNITGNLHIGHAFQQTIIDIIVRYNKMKNKNILWLMGTDHAGIITQILVENYLKKKNINISKKNIIKELWKWKKKYEKKINKQTELIGSSIFWKKTYFSLDKNFNYSVKKAFIKLYNNNLIYKKKKIINWDKKIKNSLSNLEINIKKKIVKNYFIKFKIFKKNKYIILKTTKPEKILSITAIIINNIKYKNKFVINPITNKLIKLIFNKKINKNKNIKILPNYYNKDLNFVKKNKLNIIDIFNKNGFIKKIKLYNYKKKKTKYLKFKNLKWIKKKYYLIVRKNIINFLKKKKIIKKIKNKYSKIKYSNKTNCIILPILTNQWYIKTSILSKKAIKYIKNEKILIFPKKYKKLFLYWINNTKDWCISRQIYWGHRIPIWYDKKKNQYAGYNVNYIKKKYPNIKNEKLKQDKNILDTWFSSSLWSFTLLGWPNKKNILNKFYPLNLIVSGFDIIFFWICKMIIMSLYLIKKNNIPQIPFKKIFITGLIRDENGKKMSKSLGNVIEIKDLIYGISLKKLIKKRIKNLIKNKKINKIIKNTKKFFPKGIKPNRIDTIRFYLTSIYTSTLKINFNNNKLIHSYNYCNKLWNICIYIFKIIKINKNYIKKKININKLFLIEKWILYKFNKLIINFKKNIKLFKFNLLCKNIFKFLKNYFCDWYIESNKLKLINKHNKLFLKYIINNFLKISHIITPFITEYIWKKNYKNSILNKKFPNIKYKLNNFKIYNSIFKIFKKIICFLRNFIKIKKIKKINILFILNLNLNYKNILIKNKYLFKIININNIFYFNKKNFLYIYKNIKPIIIINNIYIFFKSE